MGIATFNGILHYMQNNSADRNDDEIFEDELYNTIHRLNFAEEQDEAKTLLSDLRSMAEKQKICLVEYVLLDFVMGKGRTECSKTICEDAFGKHPTFADMMLPQHPNAYYTAMCLYNMVDYATEMKKHKIPNIAYGKESC